MYFFPVTRDGRRISVVYLPGDKEFYADMINSQNRTRPDYMVAQPSRYHLTPEEWEELVQILESERDDKPPPS